jgi:glycosyltransferase involved in cell wall biosynthesis
MPVYNGEAYLASAIDSVLAQTLPDWELVVIDDASTDQSAAIVKACLDNRVRLLQNERNRGVAFSLNKGLQEARGMFIARMDADDICHPSRLATQIAFLHRDESLGICGSWLTCFGKGRPFTVAWPTGATCVRSYMIFDTPLAHPTVCLRKDILYELNLKYDEQLQAAQDYDLWCRLADRTKMDNIPSPLLRYRLHGESVTHSRQEVSDMIATERIDGQLRKIGIELNCEDLKFHRQVGHGAGMRSLSELRRAEEWLCHLVERNRAHGVLSDEGLIQACSFVWWRVCLNSAFLGPRVWLRYYRSPLVGRYFPLPAERFVFLVNGMMAMAGRGKGPTGRLSVWDKQAGGQG